MKILSIQNQQPNLIFQRKYSQKVYPISDLSNKIKDKIELDNGKELQIETLTIGDKMFSKLQYLKNKYGEWVKSKLTFYDGRGKRCQVKLSENAEGLIEKEK